MGLCVGFTVAAGEGWQPSRPWPVVTQGVSVLSRDTVYSDCLHLHCGGPSGRRPGLLMPLSSQHPAPKGATPDACSELGLGMHCPGH